MGKALIGHNCYKNLHERGNDKNVVVCVLREYTNNRRFSALA